ncbi:hypothetical protein BDV41DRAFT_194202 [Aspergillus transmontanensis]|uniref:Tubby C-terminal-like domain-containing protein n=1 Tax=Aspergillus transmontanensis TaxID=1034304 RepID=A0A5N6W320_9EURO|nr:hypothetical protein BDV41DRAFT_194202 [Aspergillus transmontanensis]
MSFDSTEEKTRGFSHPIYSSHEFKMSQQQQHCPSYNEPVPPPYAGQFQPMPLNPQYGYPPQPYASHPQPLMGNPQYPPQSHHTQNATRSLKVEFSSLTTRHMAINDAGQGSLLCTVDLHNRNPQMEFKNAATNNTIATVHMRTFKPEMDIKLHGRDIHLRVNRSLKPETTYHSIALPTMSFTWKTSSAWKYLTFECVDQNNVTVARFKAASSFSMRKLGQLDILIPQATSGAAMDELMLTGVSFMYYQYLSHIRSTTVAVTA